MGTVAEDQCTKICKSHPHHRLAEGQRQDLRGRSGDDDRLKRLVLTRRRLVRLGGNHEIFAASAVYQRPLVMIAEEPREGDPAGTRLKSGGTLVVGPFPVNRGA